MKLSPPEIGSAAWMRVKEYALAELDRHRTQLEADQTDLKSARIRGQIAALKELLKLEEESIRPVVESTSYLFPQ